MSGWVGGWVGGWLSSTCKLEHLKLCMALTLHAWIHSDAVKVYEHSEKAATYAYCNSLISDSAKEQGAFLNITNQLLQRPPAVLYLIMNYPQNMLTRLLHFSWTKFSKFKPSTNPIINMGPFPETPPCTAFHAFLFHDRRLCL